MDSDESHFNVVVVGRFYTALSFILRSRADSLCSFINCEGQSHKTVSTHHNFWSEMRVEADSNRGPSAYQPNALPLGQTGSQRKDKRDEASSAHFYIVQELCESRGGRPGLSVLTSLLVSVDVKIYWTVLRHWSQLVLNMSAMLGVWVLR